MPQYKTPGVYVEEVSTLPPSVVEVSTAVPAFIGCTKKGGPAHNTDPVTVARISTLLEYEQIFGGPPRSKFNVTVPASGDLTIERSGSVESFESILYYCISHYFKNGGGSCYIVSVGGYGANPAKEDFQRGLDALAKEDEPTLIVLSEATHALNVADYANIVGQAALAQCADLGDRFTILDVQGQGQDPVSDFRNQVGTNHLKYGAAYYPDLRTNLSYSYLDINVEVTEQTTNVNTETTETAAKKSPARSQEKDPVGLVDTTRDLGQLKTTETALYSRIKNALAQQTVTLPPSAAVAGIYASVDRQRGVWKAPANVGLAAVLGPSSKIDNADQETLNVDPTTGKSINAIRSFTGKGTLVWGARTLDGNSNEWRYVPVRRLFIMLEESCRKATSFAVFEPNDLSTWLKVKGMIESFLYGLWEQGAFSGSKPEEAYYVHVGLGTTMTEDDILNGRMIVEVGVAAVRPAEFIVLRFSHKLQES